MMDVHTVFRLIPEHPTRTGLIEPVFGHTQQRDLRQFTLRGLTKVDMRWKLFCIVHNGATLQLYVKLAE